MKKFLRYILQYAILGVAAYLIYQTAFTRGTPPAFDRANWSQRDGFVALSVGGLTVRDDVPSLMTKARLRENLQALAKAGYRTITSDDVRAFYDEGKPLPEKALYLMFEGGRKDSVLFSQPALQETGYHASLYLYGGHLKGWNRFFIRDSEIHKVAANPFWDVNSMGYNWALINVTPQGGYSHYLTALIDGPDGKPVETQEQFDARAAEDFRLAASSIKEATGIAPVGYLFNPANTLGVSMPEALARPVEEDLEKNFPIAFTRVGESYNDREKNPRALTRMQIGPDWTPERLLLEIESRMPRSRYLDFADSVRQGLWQVTTGGIAADGARLTLSQAGGKDPFARLRGSEGFENFLCQVKVFPTAEGASLVYLRYRDPGSFVRIQTTADRVLVQEKNGTSLNTIFQYVLPLDHKGPVTLECCVKSNRLLLSVNGTVASTYPIPLTADTSRGSFALGSLGEKTRQPALFADLRLTTFPPRWVQTARVANVNLDDSLTLTAMVLPADTLTRDPVGDAAAMVAVSSKGVNAYLDMTGADAARITETVRFVKDAPASLVFAKLLRGFVLSLDAFPEPRVLAALLDTLHAQGFSAAVRLTAASAARLAASNVALTPDWLLFDAPPSEEDVEEMTTLKNRFDRARMLYREPGPDDAAAIFYQGKR